MPYLKAWSKKPLDKAKDYLKDLADLQSWRVLAPRERLIRLATTLATFATFFLISGFFLLTLLVVIYSKDLPTPDRLVTRDIAVSTTIADRNGKPLYDIYGEENRQLVRLNELPEYVKA